MQTVSNRDNLLSAELAKRVVKVKFLYKKFRVHEKFAIYRQKQQHKFFSMHLKRMLDNYLLSQEKYFIHLLSGW